MLDLNQSKTIIVCVCLTSVRCIFKKKKSLCNPVICLHVLVHQLLTVVLWTARALQLLLQGVRKVTVKVV